MKNPCISTALMIWMANNVFNNRKCIDYAINHVNGDHQKEMVQIIQVYTDIGDVSDVILLDDDAEGMILAVTHKNEEEQKIRINFPRVLNGPHDFRPVLVEMVKAAKKNRKSDFCK